MRKPAASPGSPSAIVLLAASVMASLGLFVLAVTVSEPGPAAADSVAINPSKDNTLYQYFVADGDRSNGAGDRFFAGKTDQGRIRRGVLAFNVAASIPTGC